MVKQGILGGSPTIHLGHTDAATQYELERSFQGPYKVEQKSKGCDKFD
jgi:hypothetical protein